MWNFCDLNVICDFFLSVNQVQYREHHGMCKIDKHINQPLPGMAPLPLALYSIQIPQELYWAWYHECTDTQDHASLGSYWSQTYYLFSSIFYIWVIIFAFTLSEVWQQGVGNALSLLERKSDCTEWSVFWLFSSLLFSSYGLTVGSSLLLFPNMFAPIRHCTGTLSDRSRSHGRGQL